MTMLLLVRSVAWAILLAIVVLTLSPIEARPVTGSPVNLEQTTAFILLGGAFAWGYPRDRRGMVVFVVGFAIALEAAQHLVPGRHARIDDAAVKASAAAAGAVLALVVNRKRQAL